MKLKSMLGMLALSVGLMAALPGKAQTKVEKTAEKTGEAIEKGAKAVGNKTAEVASKGASKIADKTYKGKMAPDGSNVYIDGKNRKYYVNKKGEKVYLKVSQIKNRPKE